MDYSVREEPKERKMTLVNLQSFCTKRRVVTQDIKWEFRLYFNVDDKVILITSPDSVAVTASFKTDDENFGELSNRKGFKPAPYLVRYKWIFVDEIKRMSKKVWEHTIMWSHKLISQKLTAKIRNEKGIV